MHETFSSPPSILKLLGHELRWQLVTNLAHSDLRVQELVGMVGQPQNLVSYHLHQLARSGIVHEHPSLADGRSIYYSLDLERIKQNLHETGLRLHPGLASGSLSLQPQAEQISGLRVLFVCTHNSARSQMAEGLLRTRSAEQIEVLSAGTEPRAVHPLAVQATHALGVDISQQRSKSLDEFLGQNFDVIITVCDRAREACPTFPGNPLQYHWSLPDPAETRTDQEAPLAVFSATARQLDIRIQYFLQWIGSYEFSHASRPD